MRNNNYLVSFGLSILNGFIQLYTNEIARDRPIIAFLVGFLVLLILASTFTGLSVLFKKNKSKYSKTFMNYSIIFFMIAISQGYKSELILVHNFENSLIHKFFLNNDNIKDRDFAISNREEISKIVMSDKSGNKIELKREGENWIINNKYKVFDQQINYTLQVMKDIRVKNSVSEKKIDFVIKNIATTGVKVEIYNQSEKVKSYYIGGNTSDHKGTYMIMEGSETAYILTIPNRLPGILNPKYGLEGIYVNANTWREPITISIDKKEIKSIKVVDLSNSESSFTLYKKDKQLYDYNNNKVIASSQKTEEFINNFSQLKCGPYKPKLNASDFILIKKIYIQQENSIDSLTIYNITALQNTTKEYNSSVENLYAKWNNSDLVIIQKNIFNKVLITISELKE